MKISKPQGPECSGDETRNSHENGGFYFNYIIMSYHESPVITGYTVQSI